MNKQCHHGSQQSQIYGFIFLVFLIVAIKVRGNRLKALNISEADILRGEMSARRIEILNYRKKLETTRRVSKR